MPFTNGHRPRLTGVLILSLALLACAVSSEPAAHQGEAPAPPVAPIADEIAGSWRIVAVDGAAPRALGEDAVGERTPRIVFAPGRYGGNSGCNAFGGLGLFEGGRYYAAPPIQTLIGCGDLTAQEQAITGIFHGGARVSMGSDGRLLLVGEAHRMLLEREPSPSAPRFEGGPPPVLAGTRWTLYTLDGVELRGPGREGGGLLILEADSWSGQAACATLSGGWRQEGDRIVLTGPPATTEQLCPAPAAAVDARLAALMTANPRFVTGPNGELLIAAGGHWAVGERRRDGIADSPA